MAYQDWSRGEWGDAIPLLLRLGPAGVAKGALSDLRFPCGGRDRPRPAPPPAPSYVASLRPLRVPPWRPSPPLLLAPERDRFPRFSPRGYTGSTASAGDCTRSSPTPCRSRRFSNTGEWDGRGRRSWLPSEGLLRGWLRGAIAAFWERGLGSSRTSLGLG